MPRYPIDRATNFIVEGESWTVVEYDHTSVPGIIYLSLTEGKVNLIYDDLENNIADTDKLAKYDLSTSETIQNFSVGDIINPSFTLTKNGIPCDLEVQLLPINKKVARIIDDKLTAVGEGETEVIVQLKDYPTIYKEITISVNNSAPEFIAYIEGPESIRLDREATYTLKTNSEIEEQVTFAADTELARIVSHENDSCTIHSNNLNKLGNFTLTATYHGVTYSKQIEVIPLW